MCGCGCVCVCQGVCERVCVCVCVRVCERERVQESDQAERLPGSRTIAGQSCSSASPRSREWVSVRVCVCVGEREWLCVWVRMRVCVSVCERERVRVCACLGV